MFLEIKSSKELQFKRNFIILMLKRQVNFDCLARYAVVWATWDLFIYALSQTTKRPTNNELH